MEGVSYIDFDVECLNMSSLPLDEVGIPSWILKQFGASVTLEHIHEVRIRWEKKNEWSVFKPRLLEGTTSYNWVALHPSLEFYDGASMQRELRDEAWLVVRYIFVKDAPTNLELLK